MANEKYKVIEEEQPKKDKPSTSAEIIEVPTQMGRAIRLENGEIVTDIDMLVRLYNKVLAIEKAVV
jgi:hypothetical protein